MPEDHPQTPVLLNAEQRSAIATAAAALALMEAGCVRLPELFATYLAGHLAVDPESGVVTVLDSGGRPRPGVTPELLAAELRVKCDDPVGRFFRKDAPHA